jgi:hypothetical protein
MKIYQNPGRIYIVEDGWNRIRGIVKFKAYVYG